VAVEIVAGDHQQGLYWQKYNATVNALDAELD
jgi:hypothetical protein